MGNSQANLQGMHIVVTRPCAQAEPWAKTLIELGASVSQVPLLDIVAVQEAAQLQAIKNCILDFNLYNKAIFVSQNAVTYAFEWLDSYWPQLPMGVEFFAVGETTAKLIQTHGVTVTDLGQTQGGAMTSEALLQSPALLNVKGEKILIVRGLGGRTHLGEVLSERGAKVDYCELYERRLPANAKAQFAQILQSYAAAEMQQAAQVGHSVVTLHSGESLENLISVLHEIITGEQTLPQQLILLVPSVRVAEQARNAGFTNIFTAENATDTSMLQGLVNIKTALASQLT